MGKWTALLEEKTAAPSQAEAAKTDKSPVSAVLAVTGSANAAEFLGDERPEPPDEFAADVEGLDAEPDLIETLPTCLRATGRTVARLLDGRDDECLAGLVAWLRMREAEGDDLRLCAECHHFGERGKVCRHPDLVAIQAPRDLGRLSVMPQRCLGFKEKGGHDA